MGVMTMHRSSISTISDPGFLRTEGVALEYSAEGIYHLHPAAQAGPPRIEIAGQKLERLLDYIYVPVPLERLTATQIGIVNSLRKQLPDTVDGSSANTIIKKKFVDLIKDVRAEKVLEWGCGYNSIEPWLEGISYSAVDIDSEVVHTQEKRGSRCFHTNDILPDEAQGVDVIPAIFVFQFCISRKDALNMARALGPAGIIIANVYRRTPRSRQALRMTLRSAGLAVFSRPDSERLCNTNEYWIATMGRSEHECSDLLDKLCEAARHPH